MKDSIFITGGSHGIGRELARVFADRGHRVVIHGRNRERLKKLRDELAGRGGTCGVVVGDIRGGRTEKNILAALKKYDISIFVNNAGVAGEGSIWRISVPEIREALETNLVAPINITKRIYPFFRKKGGGIIVNINSIAGLEAQTARPVYCATKWGLRGFTLALGEEAKKDNIRIVGVYPSRVRTRPEFTYGMEPRELAEKVYHCVMRTKKTECIVDNRPKKYKKYG
ncbi:MAG: SDR family oxidoreductase [Patescibacteria group bacterium]